MVLHWIAAHLYLLASWTCLAGGTALVLRWQWERVERLMKERLIREMERKAGVPVMIEALRCWPWRGELGLTNLCVTGSAGDWTHPYFMRVATIKCKAHGGVLGCASLAGMLSFDLGTHLPFVFGFKGKMVDAMTCAGMEVYVESSHLPNGGSNADFLREIDRADRRRTRARRRKAHESELQWKLTWVSDAREKAHLAKTLSALLEEDEAEREAQYAHDHAGDAEHAAFFDAVHSHLADPRSTHQGHFAAHHEKLRAKHHRVLQSRSERKAMAKSFKALRATDANRELMHVGRCTVENCTFALGKHTFHMGGEATVEAFSGTLLEFQRAVSRKVVTTALADSWAREKAIISHWSFFGRKSAAPS